MSFNALSLAKLGLGYGAKAVVTLGFLTVAVLPPETVAEPSWYEGGGGISSYVGRGFVQVDGKWVQLEKIKRVGGRTYAALVSTSSDTYAGDGPRAKASAFGATPHCESGISIEALTFSGRTFDPSVSAMSEVVGDAPSVQELGVYPVRVEWMSTEEICFIVDVFDGMY